MRKMFAMLSVLALSASLPVFADVNSTAYGEQATAAASAMPDQSVTVAQGTRSIDVQRGEVVRIADGDQTVTWHFDGAHAAFRLSQILPSASKANDVVIYVQDFDHQG